MFGTAYLNNGMRVHGLDVKRSHCLSPYTSLWNVYVNNEIVASVRKKGLLGGPKLTIHDTPHAAHVYEIALIHTDRSRITVERNSPI